MLTDSQLLAAWEHAAAAWPFLPSVERGYLLPPFILVAVASREIEGTLVSGVPPNPIYGDGGHGHGPWQLDDRTAGRTSALARIDGGDVEYAATYAASMLSGLIANERKAGYVEEVAIVRALNRYNSGQPNAAGTANHNYGPDVEERRQRLVRWFGALVPTVAGRARREDED